MLANIGVTFFKKVTLVTFSHLLTDSALCEHDPPVDLD